MRPGDVIDGKYQIEVELGEGGMGRVVAASHMALGSTVAIKVLKTEALKYPEVPRRFMREARAAGRLRSEHVVKVMDVGQLPTGEPYMVMEMLHGADLAAHIKQGAVSPALAVEYIAQACEGLAEAHAMGIVHRDIKPANLFVTRRPNGAPLVKVLDFGIATAATGDIDHNLTSTLTVIGSPSYMSPEQLRAARDVDARSDIWSLGVTLYELLSGEQPFIGPTLTALTLKIVGEPYAPLANVPPALAAIVDRCLAKQREHRFANVAQLADALAPLFPNGRVAAEMVAGSLHQPVAPTLLGLESSPAMGAQATAYPGGAAGSAGLPAGGGAGSAGYPAARSGPAGYRAASSVPWADSAPMPRGAATPTTTTDLTAGESAPMRRPAARRRAVWIVLGAAAAGAILTAGIVLSQPTMTSAAPVQPSSSAPAPAEPPPRPQVEPIVTPPPPAPAPAPAPAEPPPAPAVAPPAPTPAPEPAPEIPAPAPVKRPSPVKRPAPVKRPPPVKPELKPRPPVEPPEPVKKPCAPNDPSCGL